MDPINVKIAQLREALESVIMEQRFLKARDIRQRNSKPCGLFSFPAEVVLRTDFIYHAIIILILECLVITCKPAFAIDSACAPSGIEFPISR